MDQNLIHIFTEGPLWHDIFTSKSFVDGFDLNMNVGNGAVIREYNHEYVFFLDLKIFKL